MNDDDQTTSGWPFFILPSLATAPEYPCNIRSNPGISAIGPLGPYAVIST